MTTEISETSSYLKPPFTTHPIAPQKRPYEIDTDNSSPLTSLPPSKRLRRSGSFQPRIHPRPNGARRSSLPASHPPRYLFSNTAPVKRRRSLPAIRCKRLQDEFKPSPIHFVSTAVQTPVQETRTTPGDTKNEDTQNTWPAVLVPISSREGSSVFLKREKRRRDNAVKRIVIGKSSSRRTGVEPAKKRARTSIVCPKAIETPKEAPRDVTVDDKSKEEKRSTLSAVPEDEEPKSPSSSSPPSKTKEPSLLSRLKDPAKLFKAANSAVEKFGEKLKAKRLAAKKDKDESASTSTYSTVKKLTKPRKPTVESDTEEDEEDGEIESKKKSVSRKKVVTRSKKEGKERKDANENSSSSSDSESNSGKKKKALSRFRLRSKAKKTESEAERVEKADDTEAATSGKGRTTPRDSMMMDFSENEATERDSDSESDRESVKTVKPKKKTEKAEEKSSGSNNPSFSSTASPTTGSAEDDVEMLSIRDYVPSETSTIVDVDMSSEDDAATIINVERDTKKKESPDSLEDTTSRASTKDEDTAEPARRLTNLRGLRLENLPKSLDGVPGEKFSLAPCKIAPEEGKLGTSPAALPTPPDTPASAKSMSPTHLYTWQHTTHLSLLDRTDSAVNDFDATGQMTPRSFNLITDLGDTNVTEIAKPPRSAQIHETTSLRHRISAILSDTFRRKDRGFDPRNISRHAYRDDTSIREEDEETEFDDNSPGYMLPYLPLPSPPIDAWCGFESTSQVGGCVEQLERFTMAC